MARQQARQASRPAARERLIWFWWQVGFCWKAIDRHPAHTGKTPALPHHSHSTGHGGCSRSPSQLWTKSAVFLSKSAVFLNFSPKVQCSQLWTKSAVFAAVHNACAQAKPKYPSMPVLDTHLELDRVLAVCLCVCAAALRQGAFVATAQTCAAIAL